MHTFQDKNGKKWSIELNVGTAKRVRSECGIDLVNVITLTREGKLEATALERLADDPVLLVDCLFVLCREQAGEAGLDDFGFAALFDATAVESASDALMEEIINFSRPAKRKALEKIYQTARRFAEKMDRKLDETLDNPTFAAEIESELNRSFTDTPESSE